MTADILLLTVHGRMILEQVSSFEAPQTHATRVKTPVFAEVVIPELGRTGEYLVAVLTESVGVVARVVVRVLRTRK